MAHIPLALPIGRVFVVMSLYGTGTVMMVVLVDRDARPHMAQVMR